jgi:hypothetical protein
MNARSKSKPESEIGDAAQGLASLHPIEAMTALERSVGSREAAVQWLALATMHAYQSNAKKITLFLDPERRAWAKSVYRPYDLPPPSPGVAEAVFCLLDQELPRSADARGIRVEIEGMAIDVEVRTSTEDGERRVALKFPNRARLVTQTAGFRRFARPRKFTPVR